MQHCFFFLNYTVKPVPVMQEQFLVIFEETYLLKKVLLINRILI